MKLLIIGAGLSGLVTAQEVQRAGHEVVLVEARDRVGGRVFTIREGLRDGQYADAGAEMIYHGQDNIARLCADHELELTTEFSLGTDSPAVIFQGRRLTDEASGELAQELRAAVRRVPPGHYETVAQWLRRARLSDGAELLLEAIAQGTPASPLRLADSQELNVELSWGKGYRKIRGGNDLLPRALAKGLDIRLEQMVRLVGHGPGGVTVETDRETFTGDRVLVTVPGPLVSELGFDPVLPAAKVRALLQLRYGNGTRLVAQYAEKEEVRKAVGLGCFTDQMPGYVMEQTMQQAGDHIIISGLAAGDVEPALMNEQEVLDAFDRTISAVVGRPLTRAFGYVKNWTKDPLTRAVVRAPLGDQRETVLPEIRRPIDGRVFFAGEYTDDRVGPGGMEGAIKSAYRASKEILD
ncbi:MAG TPA: NAD(P)/FAD-dependent oxidoreductase [Candidatus Dormibacteraeota bacterium]|nr:NAD(P)/FAD-dependent oxidoreductase [Candidatus Dormibacteraeota bacterium]